MGLLISGFGLGLVFCLLVLVFAIACVFVGLLNVFDLGWWIASIFGIDGTFDGV